MVYIFYLKALLSSFPETKEKSFRQSTTEFFARDQSSRLCIRILVTGEVSVGPAVKVDHLELFSLTSLASLTTRDQEPNIEDQTETVQSSHHDNSLSSQVYSIYSLVIAIFTAKLSEGWNQIGGTVSPGTCFCGVYIITMLSWQQISNKYNWLNL